MGRGFGQIQPELAIACAHVEIGFLRGHAIWSFGWNLEAD
jgi:hypothetical protein